MQSLHIYSPGASDNIITSSEAKGLTCYEGMMADIVQFKLSQLILKWVTKAQWPGQLSQNSKRHYLKKGKRNNTPENYIDTPKGIVLIS